MRTGQKPPRMPSSGEKLPWLPQLLCGFLFCFMLFIFAPVEMVQLNSADFWFSPGDFIGAFLLLFLAAFAAIEGVFALLRLAPRYVYHGVLAFFFALTLALYIQGNFLCQTNQILDGGEPVWKLLLLDAFVNLAIWGAIFLAVMLVLLRSPKTLLKAVSYASALLILMTGGSLTVSLSSANLPEYDQDYRFYYTSREDVFTVSGNGDVHVFMLDRLDARIFDRALKENPEILSEYDGFTFYRNTAGAYTSTDPSILAMLTGAYCMGDTPFFEFSQNAFSQSTFFPDLIQNGYTVDLYGTPKGMMGEDMLSQVSNLRDEKGRVVNWPQFINPMLRMVGYRYAPAFFQPMLYDEYVDRFDAVRAIPADAPKVFHKTSNADLSDIHRVNLTVDDSRKLFKFYCYRGAHAPFTVNRYGESVLDGEVDQYEQSLGYLNYVNTYLKLMKEAGVYDQSMIVVLADHGDMYMDDTRVSVPTLLVRYPNQSGEMRVSSAPTSLVDLRATVMYGVGADYAPYGKPVHLWEEGEPRERFFYYYKWVDPGAIGVYYLQNLTEYAVPADAMDLRAYKRTGTLHGQ